MGSEQVAQVLRKVGQHVKLVIARLVIGDEPMVDGVTREEVQLPPKNTFHGDTCNSYFLISFDLCSLKENGLEKNNFENACQLASTPHPPPPPKKM